ncbi:MAG TPA: hypothetical protein VFI33_00760 [Puia sp.]|nr:hypothetical protein [Puia sp.]
MTKTLTASFLILAIVSCTFTTTRQGHEFVNAALLKSQILAVQPAKNIEMGVQIKDGRDSIIVINLEVDSKIPNDSLNEFRARLVLGSIITTISNLQSYSSCKINFIKKPGSAGSTTQLLAYQCPITPALLTNLKNYKDSTKTTEGYIYKGWVYNNGDLQLSMPLINGWYYLSQELGTVIFYTIGSDDVNQLPQYYTDPDKKISFKGLDALGPGETHSIFNICKYKEKISSGKGIDSIFCPAMEFGLVINRFDSEDEYMKVVGQIMLSKELPANKIHSYTFGDIGFRGFQHDFIMKSGQTIHLLWLMKQFRRVSLVINLVYLHDKELEEMKQALNKIKITPNSVDL